MTKRVFEVTSVSIYSGQPVIQHFYSRKDAEFYKRWLEGTGRRGVRFRVLPI